MNCRKCGCPLRQNNTFCANCGMPVAPEKSSLRVVLILIAVLAVLALGILSIVLITGSRSSNKYQEAISQGEKYLSEMDYGNAKLMFQEAISINPKQEKAYVNLARMYQETGEYEAAITVLDSANQYVESEELSRIRIELERDTEESGSMVVPEEVEPTPKIRYEIMIQSVSDASGTGMMQYPVIIASINSKIIEDINAAYKKHAQERLAEWEENVSEMTAMGEDISGYEESLSCQIAYHKDEVLSMKYESFYYAGGPHGYQYSYGIAYNLETGEELTIGDLLGCSDDIAWEAAVSVYNRTIVGKLETVTEADVRSVIRDCGYWLTEEGVMVQISQYGVASYAAGPQEALVTQADVAAVSQGTAEPSGEKISIINNIEVPASDFLFPFSSSQLLSNADLSVMESVSVEQMHASSQLAINEILARYGFGFNPDKSDTAYEAYHKFSGFAWYIEAKKYCPSSNANEMISQLNEIEKQNIEIVNNWQKAHNCYY